MLWGFTWRNRQAEGPASGPPLSPIHPLPTPWSNQPTSPPCHLTPQSSHFLHFLRLVAPRCSAVTTTAARSFSPKPFRNFIPLSSAMAYCHTFQSSHLGVGWISTQWRHPWHPQCMASSCIIESHNDDYCLASIAPPISVIAQEFVDYQGLYYQSTKYASTVTTVYYR